MHGQRSSPQQIAGLNSRCPGSSPWWWRLPLYLSPLAFSRGSLPADAGHQEGVRALTVVDGHMYIASRRHIHRIAIATQEAAFVYRGQGLTPSIAGVRDGV
ncbi:unnamed protein product [Symbiodinium sp. CCMP2456]|nr:unnamed protein product [Symbiodinium sp. CCMP2456]